MARRISERDMDWTLFDDSRRVPVVGTPWHQPALLTTTKDYIVQSTDRCEVEASLVPEPANPHDANAVQVVVANRVLGYLKRGTAKRLRGRLDDARFETYPCLIRVKSPGVYQAHLQIPYDSTLLAGYKNPSRKR